MHHATFALIVNSAEGIQYLTAQAHEVSLAILFQGVPPWQDPTPQPVSLLPQEVMSAVH